jgi:tetraacyldisaccharide 4'-kinase
MELLWLKIISNRRNPLCWPILFLLWVVSLFYSLGRRWRQGRDGTPVRLGVPVISVGNLTVGGSGKTPIVIEIARFLQSRNKTVGVVSSGYKRMIRTAYSGSGKDLVSVHFDHSAVDYVGDEVYMMAQLLPEAFFSVAENKTYAARNLLENHRVEAVIVDDGFQHRRLYRDCNLLVIEADHDLRSEKIFPLGRLREPASASARADIVIKTRVNYRPRGSEISPPDLPDSKPAVEVEFINDGLYSRGSRLAFDDLRDKRVYFFAGIGGFRRLYRYLTDNNIIRPAFHRQFKDHCRYQTRDLAVIRKDIARFGPDCLVTTFKDYVKLETVAFDRPLYYLGLRLNFIAGEKELFKAIQQVVER